MNARDLDSYSRLLGPVVFSSIMASQQRLVACGLFRNDERDDIIQDLALVCLSALEKHYKPKTDASLTTYLVCCLKCRVARLISTRARDRRTILLTQALQGDSSASDDEEGWNIENQAGERTEAPQNGLDLEQVLSKLNGRDKAIVEAIALGDSPSAACKRAGVTNSYFVRHLRPILLKFYKESQ